jgi:thiol-disulfide isomerase/thioredoxin
MLKTIALLGLLSVVSLAQQFVVTGRVVDIRGRALPSTLVRGPVRDSAGTRTDAQGYFKVVFPNNEPAHLFVIVDRTYGYGCIIPLLTDCEDSAHVTIRQDTAKEALFEFANSRNRTARFAKMHLDLSRSYISFVDGLQKLQKEGGDTKLFLSAWMDSAGALKNRVLKEEDPVIRGEYLIRYYRLTSIHGMIFDTLFYRKLATSIPANSPLWFFNNYEAYDQRSVRTDGSAYLDSIREYHPSRDLRAFILFQTAMDAQSAMNTDEVRVNVMRLKDEYPEIKWTKMADKWIYVDVKVKRGAEIPDFAFKDLDDSTVVYSKKSLKGQIFLLDFWASWCLPCIGEIPYLQKAYDKYLSKGLEIISISSDVKKSDVVNFRRQKKQMPWKNVWLQDSERKIIHDRFEVSGIPRGILVGRDGIIVGLGPDVRGELLEKALETLFGK